MKVFLQADLHGRVSVLPEKRLLISFKQAGAQILIKPYKRECRASLWAVNLAAFGATRHEAVRNLKDIESAPCETCWAVGQYRLGPGPARQFKL